MTSRNRRRLLLAIAGVLVAANAAWLVMRARRAPQPPSRMNAPTTEAAAPRKPRARAPRAPRTVTASARGTPEEVRAREEQAVTDLTEHIDKLEDEADQMDAEGEDSTALRVRIEHLRKKLERRKHFLENRPDDAPN
ncbi:MAG: hypothetical protein U0271_37600 [Polyangiaceae bacterium]